MVAEKTDEITEERKRELIRTKASTNMGIPTAMNSAVKRELEDLRQDCNILAQHLNATRKDIQEKISTLVSTSNKTEAVTSEVLEEITQRLEKGEVDIYSQTLSQVIREDNIASRKQLFEEIERIIINQEKSSGSSGSSIIHWIVDAILFIGIVVTLFIAIKGLR